MIPEDRKQAQARTRSSKPSRLEQVGMLLLGAAALLGFLLI